MIDIDLSEEIRALRSTFADIRSVVGVERHSVNSGRNIGSAVVADASNWKTDFRDSMGNTIWLAGK